VPRSTLSGPTGPRWLLQSTVLRADRHGSNPIASSSRQDQRQEHQWMRLPIRGGSASRAPPTRPLLRQARPSTARQCSPVHPCGPAPSPPDRRSRSHLVFPARSQGPAKQRIRHPTQHDRQPASRKRHLRRHRVEKGSWSSCSSSKYLQPDHERLQWGRQYSLPRGQLGSKAACQSL
jgi:hypothetical protein